MGIFFPSIILFAALVAADGSVSNVSASNRAQQTLNGLFNYYWKHDSAGHKNVEFIFVCAQIGTPANPGKCACQHPKPCLDCYRWWSAVALESIATYGILMNTTNHSNVPDIFLAHSPYNAEWNATAACTYIDDFTWYGIAYLRVHEWLKDVKWLDQAIALHDWGWEYGWDDPCGGFWWSNCDFSTFKDSIVTMEMLHLASKLANLLPNQSRFLESAMKIWDWFFSFDNGGGLMSDKFLVSTGAIPERCCNATSDEYTRCHNSGQSGTAYNQGLLMSASAYLYTLTANKTYLLTGIRAMEAILANYTTKEGILIDEPRSYQSYSYECYIGADPGGDWYSFNGIFMLHLGYFTEILVKNSSMPRDLLTRINNLVQKTSDSAWLKSAVYPPFKSTHNACSPGSEPTNKKARYPKFHWWWNSNQVQQAIPPDPRYYFHRLEIRCAGNNTQIWEGLVGSELNCTLKCNEYANCSKYLFQTVEDAVPGTDCWLWSYNRSDHICGHYHDYYDFNIGVKRPIGNATCAGHCGSNKPQRLINGTTCYCDKQCARHLDCCLDYAEQCHPNQAVSCKGFCNKPIPQPIPGGGYCWCDYGCNPWFTDNNSDGSCCPDYPEQCQQITEPICLDGRSQGSALNLFLSHITVSEMTKWTG